MSHPRHDHLTRTRARRVVLLGMAHLAKEAERQRRADAHEQTGGNDEND
jgi:hypothetical protein